MIFTYSRDRGGAHPCRHLVGALCVDAGIEGTAASAARVLASVLLDHADELEALAIELRREMAEA